MRRPAEAGTSVLIRSSRPTPASRLLCRDVAPGSLAGGHPGERKNRPRPASPSPAARQQQVTHEGGAPGPRAVLAAARLSFQPLLEIRQPDSVPPSSPSRGSTGTVCTPQAGHPYGPRPDRAPLAPSTPPARRCGPGAAVAPPPDPAPAGGNGAQARPTPGFGRLLQAGGQSALGTYKSLCGLGVSSLQAFKLPFV